MIPTTAVRERFARDDLPHRLGALAANLLRVETFCRRSGSLELARRVMTESKSFVEWSARNASVEVAAELVQLQRELTSYLRRWPRIAGHSPIAEEMAQWAAAWAARVLAMSGLSESGPAAERNGVVIPENHKFAVMALGGVWHQIEQVVTDGGTFTRSAPIARNEFWIARNGDNWAEAVWGADLYLVATIESSNDNLDQETTEVGNRCDLMRHGLALASGYFKCGNGFLLIGTNGRGQMSVRETGQVPGLLRHPDSRAVQLTKPDFLRAGRFARDLYAPFMTTGDRLKLSVESFMDGMESREAVERVHYFVRSVEGVIRPRKSSTQKDFVVAVQSVLTRDHTNSLKEMFRIRSADEHLHDPMEEIAASSAIEKDRILLMRAAEAEAIARTFLTRVLENTALRERRFPSDPGACGAWSDQDRELWGMPLDLDAEVRHMTTRP